MPPIIMRDGILDWKAIQIAGARGIVRCTEVIPLDDFKPHYVNARHDCWCNPFPHDEEPNTWVHTSFDGREAFQEGERKVS